MVRHRIFVRNGGIFPNCRCNRQLYRGDYFTMLHPSDLKRFTVFQVVDQHDYNGEWRILVKKVDCDLSLEIIAHVIQLNELDEDYVKLTK